MNCPRCQQIVREGARFCDSCGFSIGSLAAKGESAYAETLEIDPLVGHTLEDKYLLLEPLGKGGMGVVYHAERVLVGDEVAVKVLRSELVAEPEAVERFRREARAAARLRHPNIVVIYDYGEARGDDAPAYIVMELIRGTSLRDLLKGEGRLKPQRVVDLMRGICAGIGMAHRNQIVHRDIKPDNVIVLPPDEDEGREQETVKVVDFGIAKLRDPAGGGTLTQKGFQPGTVYYMSPEQCRGDELDARSDVYSLGALCYEMLTGTPPFTGETRTGVMAKHLFDPPPPFAAEAGIPAALEAVIMRALSKDPDERQADANELARELREAEQAEQDSQQRRSTEQVSQKRAAAAQPRAAVEEAQRKAAEAEAAHLQLKEEAARRREEAERVSAAQASEQQAAVAQAELTDEDDLTVAAPRRHVAAAATEGEESEPPRAPVKRDGGKRFMWLAFASLLITIGVAAFVWWQSRTKPATVNPATAQPTATAPQPTPSTTQTVSPQTPPAGMVYIPGGEFQMGLNGRDGGDEYERPAHTVTVKPFFMDVHEVTNEEYATFVSETNHQPPPTWTDGRHQSGTGRKPVTGVTWEDANAYARWAGKRLPTEEEWEFAARGTDGRRYPWGNEWSAGLANADGASTDMAKAGTYTGASPFGVVDMVGNAWEWTASEMKAYPGGQLPQPAANNDKVLRGGSYKSNRAQATTTYRFGWPASGAASYTETGFRCVKDLTASATP